MTGGDRARCRRGFIRHRAHGSRKATLWGCGRRADFLLIHAGGRGFFASGGGLAVWLPVVLSRVFHSLKAGAVHDGVWVLWPVPGDLGDLAIRVQWRRVGQLRWGVHSVGGLPRTLRACFRLVCFRSAASSAGHRRRRSDLARHFANHPRARGSVLKNSSNRWATFSRPLSLGCTPSPVKSPASHFKSSDWRPLVPSAQR